MSNHPFLRPSLAALLLGLAVLAPAGAAPTVEVPPAAEVPASKGAEVVITPKSPPAVTVRVEGRKKSGTASEMRVDGFTAKVDGQPVECRWEDFDPATITRIASGAANKSNPDHLLWLAQVYLRAKGGGMTEAGKCWENAARALKLGKPQAEELANREWDAYAGAFNAGRPKWAWPRLSTAQQAAHVDKLRTAAVELMTGAGVPADKIIVDESEHFIFLTDAGKADARAWGAKIESSYKQLCKLFAVDPRERIWTGKCLIVIFASEQRYHAFHARMGIDSQGSLGLNIGNGFFHGSNSVEFFIDKSKPALTEIVLNHELSHAFTSHFCGNDHLISWANEGLAEYMSNMMAPSGEQTHEQKMRDGADATKQWKSLQGMYGARNIAGIHYGVAEQMTELMVQKSGPGYADFVRDCTRGVEPEKALRENLEMDYAALTEMYGRRIGVKGLKP